MLIDIAGAVDTYFIAQEAIHKYFGYVEDWVVIPLEDSRQYFWHLEGEGPGSLSYAPTEADLKKQGGDHYYEDSIYTQRFLPSWVYRGKEYTLVCCDTHVDGNKFLRILDNEKER